MRLQKINQRSATLSCRDRRRTQNLAEIFHRLHLIESYGTGIRRIYHLYENCPVQPRIEVTPNAFKIVLPNLNTSVNTNEITAQEQQVLDFITENGFATDMDIQELLKIKSTRTFAIMKKMREKGLIKQEGRGVSKRYVI